VTSLEDHYRDVQSPFLVEEAPDYADLVVPTGNTDEPVHRWFHVKEAFSHRLLPRVLKDLGLAEAEELRVLDPYAGSGTTAASAAAAVRDGSFTAANVAGVECNGFLHLVASAKIAALRNPPKRLNEVAERVASRALASQDSVELPALSTFQNSDYFERDDVAQLVRLRLAIDATERRGSAAEAVALLRVALGATIEPICNLRRDGRTLRYSEKRTRPPVIEAWRAKVAQIEADLPTTGIAVDGDVHRGDARTLDDIAPDWTCDLALFSPPYPNNIDYTEVYKLENWLLGFITSGEEFTSQRLRTAYSHPSILRVDPMPAPELSEEENRRVAGCIDPVVDALPADRYFEGRRRMFRGYAVDMYRTLRAVRRTLRPGADVVYVVGNSAHGGREAAFVVAADIIIAQVAEVAGLSVQRIAVARYPRRRSVDSAFLRESVVFLKG